MYRLLDGLRVVEGASFIAGPSCGLHLNQLGAEVIRFDQIGGGPDFGRWPLARSGASLYWEGLNKGKKSVALDLASPAGRELAVALITAPGKDAGLFVTNYPVRGFLSHERLAESRADLISCRVMGWANGDNALDYTVNAALGVPLMTGPETLGDAPVNHVLPAWDLATGLYAALALVAAERQRSRSGKGVEIRVPLGDVAMASLGAIGQIAEVTASGQDRPRYGNDLFGAFGRDFPTADGHRIVLIALTPRQWRDMVERLGLGVAIAALQAELGTDFAADEGQRFLHRARLNALVGPAVAQRTLGELTALFAGTSVCWGPYGTLAGAIGNPGLISNENPLFSSLAHPGGETYLTPGAAGTFIGEVRAPPAPAPRLGEHTDQVLAEVLGLPGHAIARLHDQRTIAGPAPAQHTA